MSYNEWLYVYGNPLNQVDRSGHYADPCEKIPVDYTGGCRQSQQMALLIDRTDHPENYDPGIAPPIINSWNPDVTVNLASDISQGVPNAQVIGGNGHFCGQVSLAMIEETILGPGGGSRLSTIITGINKYGGTLADDLAIQAVKDLPDWQAAVYSYSQVLKYTYDQSTMRVTGNYLYKGSSSWFAGATTIQTIFKKMLEANHYLIVFTETTKLSSWATLQNHSPGETNHAEHWVVLKGMSQNWVENDEHSIMNWVKINNPFGNREEYYPWWYFKGSMSVYPYTAPYLLEIYPKTSLSGWQLLGDK
jgi:hypothetical protein